MGFNTKRVKIWTIWDTPWNLQYRSEWWKKHLQLAGSVAALILWHRQIYTSQWHPGNPRFLCKQRKLSLEESSVRISDVSITGTSSGVKKIKKPLTNCQLWMIGDPLGAPQNHWKKPNRLKPLPLDFLLLICFITFRCQHPASTSRRSSRCK